LDNTKAKLDKYITYVGSVSTLLIWAFFWFFVSWLLHEYIFNDSSIFFIFIIIQCIYFALWLLAWIPNVITYKIIGKKLLLDNWVHSLESAKLPNRLYVDDSYDDYLERLMEPKVPLNIDDKTPAEFMGKNKDEIKRVSNFARELKITINVLTQDTDLIKSWRLQEVIKEAFDIVFPARKASIQKSKWD
jgi:hypothetical protein